MRDEVAIGTGPRERIHSEAQGPRETRDPVPVPPWERRSRLYVWGYGPPRAIVVRTRVTLWGYGRPQSMVLQNGIEETTEAQEWAAARGWDAARSGAWAGEITTPLSAAAAEKALAPTLRLDPAIAGWSGRDLEVPSSPRAEAQIPTARREAVEDDRLRAD